jgi:hypothetical protein
MKIANLNFEILLNKRNTQIKRERKKERKKKDTFFLKYPPRDLAHHESDWKYDMISSRRRCM